MATVAGLWHSAQTVTPAMIGPFPFDVTFSIDPTTWSSPWTAVIPREKSVDEYACHEGHDAMDGVLTGTRAAEKAGGRK